jgi:uncharacterized protein (TIGR03435 family)
MDDATDMDLLRQYAEQNSDTAFATLVSRHLNLVHSAALRKTGDPDAAEEITQAVFIILAQKAARISDKTILPGWLYQTARLTAAGFLKSKGRRARREHEAFMQTELRAAAPDEAWEQLAPLLDDAMGQLGEKERAAVVLRFFDGKSFAEVSMASGVTENAAKKRVAHALEKLRKFFTKRGVVLNTGIIAGAISAKAVQAAPAALTKSIAAIAITKGAAAGGSTLTLIEGALKIMAWTKTKTAIVAGLSVLIAGETTVITVKEIQKQDWFQSPDTYWWQVSEFDKFHEKQLLEKPVQLTILPTKFNNGGWAMDGTSKDSMIVGVKHSIQQMIQSAFQVRREYADRIVYPAGLPPGEYDYISSLRHGAPEALQSEIAAKFGVAGKFETLATNVLLLKVKSPNAPGLIHGVETGKSVFPDGEMSVNGMTISHWAAYLEMNVFHIPVIDQTGLNGGFAFDLKWNEKGGLDQLKQAIVEQLGLELVPGVEPVEMLVVEKSN